MTATSPDWAELRGLAAGQAGHFTAAEAKAHGFSEQLLSKHVASGNLERPQRGIYRLAHFPVAENEEFVVAWLWSGGKAVVSHESALRLQDLSDSLPARVHLTLPRSEEARRRVVPPAYILHYADLSKKDWRWIGAVPVTTPARTIVDVAAAHGDAGVVEQAVHRGIHRHALQAIDVAEAFAYIGRFQTPGWRVFPEAVAQLGNGWAAHAYAGTCGTKPPTDWPTLAREVVERHGGRLYFQDYQEKTLALAFHVVWPLPGPSEPTRDSLRQALAAVFAWR